jgi:hypothetical protein
MHRLSIAGIVRVAAVLVALSGLSGTAGAQAPSAGNVQLGRDIVVASGATRAFENVIPAILDQTLNLFLQQNPDLQKDLAESLRALAPEFDKRKQEVVDIVARVYASRFTEPELKEILNFYRSSTGKKLVAQLPGILEESYIKTQEWSGKLSEEVVIRLRAEMKKRGHTI